MSKQYRIRPGYSFRDSDESVKTAGDTIELADDVAAANAEKIEPLETTPSAPSDADAASGDSHE